MGRLVTAEVRAPLRGLAALPAVVLLVYGVTPSLTSGIREDEVQCEEAKAHLMECCDEFIGHLECKFVAGCGETLPDLDVSEARAIQERSCDEIRNDGSCAKDFRE